METIKKLLIYILLNQNGSENSLKLMSTNHHITAVASMRRTEALASVKFYQILSIFIFFIRLIILEDFIRLISYNGPCVRLSCSFFLATPLHIRCTVTLGTLTCYHLKIFLPSRRKSIKFMVIKCWH